MHIFPDTSAPLTTLVQTHLFHQFFTHVFCLKGTKPSALATSIGLHSLRRHSWTHKSSTYFPFSPVIYLCQFNLQTWPGTLRGSKKISLLYVTHPWVHHSHSFFQRRPKSSSITTLCWRIQTHKWNPTHGEHSVCRERWSHMHAILSAEMGEDLWRSRGTGHSGGMGMASSSGLHLSPWRRPSLQISYTGSGCGGDVGRPEPGMRSWEVLQWAMLSNARWAWVRDNHGSHHQCDSWP